MVRKLTLFIVLFFSYCSFGQLDSIMPNYKKYKETNPDKAMSFLEEGVKLAEQQNLLKKKAYYLNLMIDLKGRC
jgi:hypothetical protein